MDFHILRWISDSKSKYFHLSSSVRRWPKFSPELGQPPESIMTPQAAMMLIVIVTATFPIPMPPTPPTQRKNWFACPISKFCACSASCFEITSIARWSQTQKSGALLCFVIWFLAKWPRSPKNLRSSSGNRCPLSFLEVQNSFIRLMSTHSSPLLAKPRMTSSILRIGKFKWSDVLGSVALT